MVRSTRRRRMLVGWLAAAVVAVLVGTFVPSVRACLAEVADLLVNGEVPGGG
jgi:hypothetical protein